LGIGAHGSERLFQIVRGRIGKGLQIGVRSRELFGVAALPLFSEFPIRDVPVVRYDRLHFGSSRRL
jgi:hypothetical protein